MAKGEKWEMVELGSVYGIRSPSRTIYRIFEVWPGSGMRDPSKHTVDFLAAGARLMFEHNAMLARIEKGKRGVLWETLEQEDVKIASDPNTTREEYIANVATEGYIPTYPDVDELQLDLDNELHITAFQRSFEVLKNNLRVLGLDEADCKMQMSPSRSGKGMHVRIRLTGLVMDDILRIALQSALGSDPVRELLGILRAQRGDAHPSMLVEKEDWKKEI